MNNVQLLYQMVNRFCDYQEARAAKNYDVARAALLVAERTILDHVIDRVLLGEPGVCERAVIITAANRYRGAIAKFLPKSAPTPPTAAAVYMRQYRKEKRSCPKPQPNPKPKSRPKPARRSRSARRSSASAVPRDSRQTTNACPNRKR